MNNTTSKRTALAAAIVTSLFLVGCGEAETNAEPTLAVKPVNVVTLSDSERLQSQRFSGVIRSQDTAKLAFRVQGTLEEILINEGDEVKEGQVLARLDPHDFQVRVNETQAQLNEAKAAHRLSLIELNRTRQATRDNAIASINLDRAISAEARAKSGVSLLEQSLVKAKDALRYTELKAPFDGVVAQRFIDNHEQTTPGQQVITVNKPGLLEAIINVPERKLGSVKIDMPAKVQWYENQDGADAIITKVASIPDSFKRTYEVTFALTTAPDNLFPGKAVNVQISSDAESNNLDTFCLTPAAVISHETKMNVVKAVNDKAVYVPVEVVSQSVNQLCVKGAIKAGDNIVTSGGAFLLENDDIKLLDEVRK